MTLTSVLLAITPDGILRNPNLEELQIADSVHVLAFTSHGELLVAESEGCFTLEEWNGIHDVGRRICCDETEEDAMQDDVLDEKAGGMMNFVKSVLAEKVKQDLQWKK